MDGETALDFAARLEVLERRINALEKMMSLQSAQEIKRPKTGNVSPEAVDSALRELGERVKDGRTNRTYFSARFRDYEAAIADVRMMGSLLGDQMAKANLRPKVVKQPERFRLKSKLCTQADMESDWALFWLDELRLPRMYHRKWWELAYIAQALWAEGKISDGMAGLGFGCGREPLPSLFVKYGAKVLATDLGASDPAAQVWAKSNQHSRTVAGLRKKRICSDELLLDNIQFRPLNMKQIDSDLFGQFDFCWSACALEHLGSIEDGLEFIMNSVKTLKSGGVAVHTTEFSLDPEKAQEKGGIVLYREGHLVDLAERLRKEGFEVAEFDLEPGAGILDRFADLHSTDNYTLKSASRLHLKSVYDGFVHTSVGIVITAP